MPYGGMPYFKSLVCLSVGFMKKQWVTTPTVAAVTVAAKVWTGRSARGAARGM